MRTPINRHHFLFIFFFISNEYYAQIENENGFNECVLALDMTNTVQF